MYVRNVAVLFSQIASTQSTLSDLPRFKADANGARSGALEHP